MPERGETAAELIRGFSWKLPKQHLDKLSLAGPDLVLAELVHEGAQPLVEGPPHSHCQVRQWIGRPDQGTVYWIPIGSPTLACQASPSQPRRRLVGRWRRDLGGRWFLYMRL